MSEGIAVPSGRSETFLGLTKAQFQLCLVLLLAFSFALNGYGLLKQNDLATEGSQSHAAICEWRRMIIKRVADNDQYLRETPEQRAARLGEALSHIPAPVIRKSTKDLQSTIHALDGLHCE